MRPGTAAILAGPRLTTSTVCSLECETKSWRPDDALMRVRLRNTGSVVTLDVHRSGLGNSNRLAHSSYLRRAPPSPAR